MGGKRFWPPPPLPPVFFFLFSSCVLLESFTSWLLISSRVSRWKKNWRPVVFPVLDTSRIHPEFPAAKKNRRPVVFPVLGTFTNSSQVSHGEKLGPSCVLSSRYFTNNLCTRFICIIFPSARVRWLKKKRIVICLPRQWFVFHAIFF